MVVTLEQKEFILILDFGSQYTQLIARRVRELNIYCEIHPFHLPLEKIRALNPKGIILSGGPSSVYGENAPLIPAEVLRLNLPVLGICYGMQLLAHLLEGKVEPSREREFGFAELTVSDDCALFSGISPKSRVWMSHGDRLAALPQGFRIVAHTANAPMAAIAHENGRMFGLQFHPEVNHTAEGMTLLRNFLYGICGCTGLWTSAAFIEESVARIREQVGRGQVLLGLSGGVDSSVAAVLLTKRLTQSLAEATRTKPR